MADIPSERFDTNFWYSADANRVGKTQTTKAALIEGYVLLSYGDRCFLLVL